MANWSTKDAIATALYTALNYLELPGTYVRKLFVDYSSAFNTIISDILVEKLSDLDVSAFIFFVGTVQWQLSYFSHASNV